MSPITRTQEMVVDDVRVVGRNYLLGVSGRYIELKSKHFDKEFREVLEGFAYGWAPEPSITLIYDSDRLVEIQHKGQTIYRDLTMQINNANL